MQLGTVHLHQELERDARQDDSACPILMQPESSAWNGAAHSLENSSYLNYADLENPFKDVPKDLSSWWMVDGGCGGLNENGHITQAIFESLASTW